MFPKTDNPRPPLPRELNPHLLLTSSSPPAVKFQTITRDSETVLVGRIKIQTPGGHAYVLRRYDTGYISLTTMWKAAFPDATPQMERDEISWVKDNYPHEHAEGERLRLAGYWLPVPVATQLAPSYSLDRVLSALAQAAPEPGSDSRGRLPASTPSHPTQKSTGPNKRRKEQHHDEGASPTPNGTTATPNVRELPARQKTKSPGPTRNPPSRAAKAKSPIPAIPTQLPSLGAVLDSSSPVKKPTSAKRTRSSILAAAAAQQQQQAQQAADSDLEEPEIPGPDPETDIAEQRALLARLKAEQQEEKQPSPSRRRRTSARPSTKPVSKRTREEAEAPLQLAIQEHPEEELPPAERAIVTNSRIKPRWPSLPSIQLQPQQKSAAWGTLAFAIGVGATAFLPQFF